MFNIKQVILIYSVLLLSLISGCDEKDSVYNDSLATNSITEQVQVNETTAEYRSVGLEGFTIEIPDEFSRVSDTSDLPTYKIELENKDVVFFHYNSPTMYTVDTGNYDITPKDVYELLKDSKIPDCQKGNVYFSIPKTEVDVTIVDCSFIYQTGTMQKQNSNESYYYEALYGVIPCNKPDFNIEKAPTKWVVYSYTDDDATKEYIHSIIKHTIESARYTK